MQNKQGLTFIKFLKAQLQYGVISDDLIEILQENKTDKKVLNICKDIVSAGATFSNEYNSIVSYNLALQEFVTLLNNGSILGKLVGVRKLPFNQLIPAIVGGASANWVGETKPILVSNLSLGENIQLSNKKLGAIVVLTSELMRFTNDYADEIVRDTLITSLSNFLDNQFIDPSITANEDKPASITNGATQLTTTGDPAKDFTALLKAIAEHSEMASPYIVLGKKKAIDLAGLRGAGGNAIFPDLTATGGIVNGVQVITSGNIDNNLVVALDANEILLADDGQIDFDYSKNGALTVVDAQGKESLVSLPQENLIAVKGVKTIDYKRRRNGAVAYIEGVTW